MAVIVAGGHAPLMAYWGCRGGHLGPCDVRAASLKSIFGNPCGRIFADWFTGEITAPQGEMIEYVHMAYASRFERYLTGRNVWNVRLTHAPGVQFNFLLQERVNRPLLRVANKDPIPFHVVISLLFRYFIGHIDLSKNCWRALGPIGDFLYSSTNRHGQNLAEGLLGPVLGGELLQGVRLTFGNISEMVKTGEAKNVGHELVQFAKGLTPGGSLWYSRVAFDRLIADEMTAMIDPNATERFRRIERRAQKEFDQRYWWSPGDRLPQ